MKRNRIALFSGYYFIIFNNLSKYIYFFERIGIPAKKYDYAHCKDLYYMIYSIYQMLGMIIYGNSII